MTVRVEKAAPILGGIRKHESDGAVRGQGVACAYDVVYGGIPAKFRPMEPLTSYPVAEVLEWQRFVVAKGAASSAAGAYQIIRMTLLGMELPSDRVFDEAGQDGAALVLLDRRGWAECEAGRMKPSEFADMLAREWASLPVQRAQRGAVRMVKRGQSYYAGDGLNRASATPEAVMVAVSAALMDRPPPPDWEARFVELEARVKALEDKVTT